MFGGFGFSSLGFGGQAITLGGSGAGTLWSPPGMGSTLKLDLLAGTYDLGAGGDVLRWHDSSGNGFHAENATTANQPTPEAAGLDGKPCVRFVKGNADWLQIDALASQLAGEDTPFTVGIYGQILETVSNGTILGGGRLSATTPNMQLQFPHAGAAHYRAYRDGDTAGGAADRTTLGTLEASGAQRLWLFTFDGSSIAMRVDGGAVTWSSSDWGADAATFETLTIGAYRNSSGVLNPWGGRIRRFSLWPGTVLSAPEIADWENNVALH